MRMYIMIGNPDYGWVRGCNWKCEKSKGTAYESHEIIDLEFDL